MWSMLAIYLELVHLPSEGIHFVFMGSIRLCCSRGCGLRRGTHRAQPLRLLTSRNGP